jgi:hypothetical protein
MLLEYIYSTGVTNDDRHFVIVQVTTLCVIRIDIESQNRLLKVCYVPATSAGLSRLLFLSFLQWPLTVLMKQIRQAVRTFKQSILLRCPWLFATTTNIRLVLKYGPGMSTSIW